MKGGLITGWDPTSPRLRRGKGSQSLNFKFWNGGVAGRSVRVYGSDVWITDENIMEKKCCGEWTFDRIIKVLLVVAALIFSLSYAFGQYVRYRESNVRDLEAWMDCAQTDQFTDRAYEFCKEKAEENYLFKKPYHWGTAVSAPTSEPVPAPVEGEEE